MNVKILLAALLAGALALWMLSGNVIVSGTADEATIRPPAERSETGASLFRVRAAISQAVERPRTLTLRGRTRADALVHVAAETPGRVIDRPVSRGFIVEKGDALCQLDEGVKAAELARAEAERAKAQLEYDAASRLQGRGFESETRVAATRAALDAAEAAVAAAELELERTTVRAPLAGVVQEPLVEMGAVLAVGEVCATIVDADPIIVTGQVAERDVTDLRLGSQVTVDLVTGETVEGELTFVSRTADPDTRTFKVEITVPNENGALRDGVTAEALIPLPPVTAHRLSPGVLTLSDAGQVGVRTVDDDRIVNFLPVTITKQDTEGVWVTGLPDMVTIITVGQDYVVEGQEVIAEPRASSNAAATASRPVATTGNGA